MKNKIVSGFEIILDAQYKVLDLRYIATKNIKCTLNCIKKVQPIVIDLSCNEYSIEIELLEIYKAMLDLEVVKELYLDYCKFHFNPEKIIRGMIKFCGLNIFSITGCGLSSDVMEGIIKEIKGNWSIYNFDLYGNHFTEDSEEDLLTIEQERSTHKIIDSMIQFEQVVEQLNSYRWVEYLEFRDIDFRDEFPADLEGFLLGVKGRKKIVFNGCTLEGPNIGRLMAGVKEIYSIKFHYCKILEECTWLHDEILNNPGLVELKFIGSPLGVNFYTRLFQAINKTQKIEVFYHTNSKMRDQYLRRLMDLLVLGWRPNKIDIRYNEFSKETLRQFAFKL